MCVRRQHCNFFNTFQGIFLPVLEQQAPTADRRQNLHFRAKLVCCFHREHLPTFLQGKTCLKLRIYTLGLKKALPQWHHELLTNDDFSQNPQLGSPTGGLKASSLLGKQSVKRLVPSLPYQYTRKNGTEHLPPCISSHSQGYGGPKALEVSKSLPVIHCWAFHTLLVKMWR